MHQLLMPAVAGTLLLLASLTDLRTTKGPHRRPAFARRPLSYMAGLAALVPLTPVIGLLPALAVLVFGILHFIEHVTLSRAAVITAATVTGSWLLFERLLSVPLPKSMFW